MKVKRPAKHDRNPNPELDIEEEIPVINPTRRQMSDAAKKKKKAAMSLPEKSLKLIKEKEFIRLRTVNAYELPKDTSLDSPFFHNRFQERCYFEVYPERKERCVVQHTIDFNYLKKNQIGRAHV